jgi:hypothetical protein
LAAQSGEKTTDTASLGSIGFFYVKEWVSKKWSGAGYFAFQIVNRIDDQY